MTVASADLDVSFALEEADVPFIDLEQYLDARLQRACVEAASLCCNSVAATFNGRFVHMGCDIAGLMRMELYNSIKYALSAAAVVLAAIEKHRPARIVHFGEMQRATFSSANAPPDIFNAVVACCAEHCGIPASPVFLDQPHVPSGKSENPPTYESVVPGVSPSHGDNCSVLFVCPGSDYREDEQLHRAISGLDRPDWFLVLPAGGMSGLGHVCIDYLLGLPFASEDLSRRVESLRNGNGPGIPLGTSPAAGELKAGKCLSFVWREYAERLVRGAGWYSFGRFLAHAFAPELAVVGWDSPGHKRCMIQGLQDAGIQTLSIIHGGVPKDSFVYRSYCERTGGHVAVWSRYEAGQMALWRAKGYRTVPVGCLRTDIAQLAARSAGPEGRQPLRSAGPAKRPKVVLFTTLVSSLIDTTFGSSPLHRQSWRKILRMCQRHPEWDMVIKKHPRWDYDTLYESRAFRAVDNLRLSEAAPIDLLVDADVAVLVNNISTTAMESILAGVPVVFLREAVTCTARQPLVEDGGAQTAETVEELERQIERLLAEPAHREELLRRQRTFVHKHICATGAEAAQNVTRLIGELVDAGPSRAAARDARAWAVVQLILCVDVFKTGLFTYRQFRDAVKQAAHSLTEQALRAIGLSSGSDLGRHLLWVAADNYRARGNPTFQPWRVYRTRRVLPKHLRPSLGTSCGALVAGLHCEANKKPVGLLRRGICLLALATFAPARLSSRVRRFLQAASRCSF
ncbi:MAG: hypothetical protein JXR37_12530 [Kiritimatiellae bacterium]|nr:hypothetical protein [Kiritimatiellia bacterium]